MDSEISKKLKRVSNVEKNFLYECEICYEDYDTVKHIPMIVCSNYHAICAQCVKSNLFKLQYNASKIPTGKFMCSKCSEFIQKDEIREHRILKQVCTYIKTIRQKDQQLKNQFYNHVGTMGMNLVAMRQDFGTIEQNNLCLKKQNELLIKQNCKLRDEFNQIQKIKGSFEELQKAAKKLEEMKQTFEFQNAKLQSLKDQVKKKDQQVLGKRNQLLAQNQKYFDLQAEIRQLRQNIKVAAKKSQQLFDQNQGAINLKQYLEQKINNLQNEKKKIIDENVHKKRKINQSLKIMQKYWESAIKGQQKLDELIFAANDKDDEEMIQAQQKLKQKRIDEKQNQLKASNKIPKLQAKYQIELKKQKSKLSFFDQSEKSIKNFLIQNQTVTLTNNNLSHFAHISFDQGFKFPESSQGKSFSIKIKQLQFSQIMIGFMSEECKHKKNIYNKKGFYAVDGFGKVWIDGNTENTKFVIKQGSQIEVSYVKQSRSLVFTNDVQKNTQNIKIPQHMKNKNLYPVVLLLNGGDSFEVLEVK